MNSISGTGKRRFAAVGVHFSSLQVLTWPESIEIRCAPHVEALLQQVAQENGNDAEQLVQETIAHMLKRQALLLAGVKKGIAQATTVS